MSDVVLTEVEFATLAGRFENSEEVRRFIASVGESARVEEFEGERRYLTFPAHGFDIVLDEGRVSSCHLINRADDSEVRPYSGALPHGLSFTNSRDAVIRKLGTPARGHAGRDDPRPMVRVKPWVKYEYPGHSLHVEFAPDSSYIELVTLLVPAQRRR